MISEVHADFCGVEERGRRGRRGDMYKTMQDFIFVKLRRERSGRKTVITDRASTSIAALALLEKRRTAAAPHSVHRSGTQFNGPPRDDCHTCFNQGPLQVSDFKTNRGLSSVSAATLKRLNYLNKPLTSYTFNLRFFLHFLYPLFI